MHTKISSDFWSHPEIEPASSETKLAAIWLLTNERMKMCGYAEITEKRFAFETDLPPAAFKRTLEALPKTFAIAGKGYVAPNFIRWQFGTGQALAKSHMSVPIVRDLHACPRDVVLMLLSLYPELSERYEAIHKQALREGSPSPTQGQREGAGEGAGEGVGTGEGDPKGAKRPPRGSATRPDEHPEPERNRMLAVGEVMRRKAATAWNDAEKKALKAAGLLELADEDFREQVEAMRRFYRAQIPDAKARTFWRRTTLPILLNNWPSELDKARAWLRDVGGEGDGVTKI